MKKQESWKIVLSKLGAIVLAVAMVITLLPMVAMQASAETKGEWTAAGNYTSGDLAGSGTAADPYLISSGADFAKLAKDTTLAQAGKYFKLTANIDLSEHYWVPAFKFIGTFDGDGKMISGVRIGTAEKSAAYQYAGLMQQVQGTVKNLVLDVRIYVTNASGKQLECGGIAGRLLSGSIDNCTVTGVINGQGDNTFAAIGGVVGRTNGGSVVNCTNKANVIGASNGVVANVAGVVARVNGTVTIANCVNIGDVNLSKTSTAGSVVAGICFNNNQSLTISNCLSIGNVTKDAANASVGTVANIYGGTGTTTCTNTYTWDGSKYVNETDASKTCTDDEAMIDELNANISTGWLTWTLDKDGNPMPGTDLIPRPLKGTVTISGATKAGVMLSATVADCNVDSGLSYQWYRSTADGYEAIAGANEAAYTLTEEDVTHTLKLIVSVQGYDNALEAVTAEITEAPSAEKPADFAANLTISGKADLGATLTVIYTGNAATVSYQWYRADNAEAEPQAIEGATSSTYTLVNADVGMIVGCTVTSTDITVIGSEAVAVDGVITAPDITGSGTQEDPYKIYTAAGLAEFAQNYKDAASTSGKYFELAGNIDMSDYAWTVIAEFHGILDGKGYTVSGLKIGTKDAPHTVGGRVGFIGLIGNSGVVKNLVLDVEIYTDAASGNNTNHLVGGIAAENRGQVLNCGVSGVIDVKMNAAKQMNIGGVVGRNTANGGAASIINCYNTASITAEQKGATVLYAGGIAGINQTQSDDYTFKAAVINCYNTGAIAGKAPEGQNVALGGIVGQLYRKQTLIANCYNTGSIKVSGGNDLSGSILGNNAKGGSSTEATGAVENVYWLEGTAAKGLPNNKTVSNVVSMTAEQMKGSAFVKTLNDNVQALGDAYTDVCMWSAGSGSPRLTGFRGNSSANTGDSTQIVLMSTVLVCSAGCILITLVLSKKRKWLA